jgi:hypothetical protein
MFCSSVTTTVAEANRCFRVRMKVNHDRAVTFRFTGPPRRQAAQIAGRETCQEAPPGYGSGMPGGRTMVYVQSHGLTGTNST